MKENILYLDSPLKDKAYGGHLIYDRFGLGDDANRKIGEYWAISAHDNGQSMIKSGEYMGKTLKEVYHLHRELFANSNDDCFPLLVKINELNGAASIQVHPDDEYAKVNCNDLGKAEFCLYLEVEPNSKLVRGHTAQSKEEFKEMAVKGKWDTLICRRELKKDEFVYTPPGIVHGGEGHILMAEVQQSSDTTYRIYDYDNVDEYGNPRETHLDKALEVVTIPHKEPEIITTRIKQGENDIINYIKNEFFIISRYVIKETVEIANKQYSLCLILAGEGIVNANGEKSDVKQGDAFIITSHCKTYEFEGNLDVLISEPPVKEIK